MDEVLQDKIARRRKLYEKMETGNINLQDIGPRLKELNSEILQFEEQKAKILEKHQDGDGLKIKAEELKPYIDDLRETLMTGSIPERKGFIRSFVKQITVDYPQLEMEYTFPLPINKTDRTSTQEVLSMKQYGVSD